MNLELDLISPVPLSVAAHNQAEQFRRHQSNPGKAKQVYLNTLAVYATRLFLQSRGVETDLDQSDWNLVMQSLMDVAALSVRNTGKLECRPVLPDSKWVHVPAEVWSERIGYVAVQLHESLREATLLGFIPQVQTEKFPLKWLQPLEALPEYLKQHQPSPVQLSQWLHNDFEAGWQAVAEYLLQSPLIWDDKQMIAQGSVRRAKLVEMRTQLDEISVVLVVEVTPTAPEREINVKVYPTGDRPQLPQNLQVMILDTAAGGILMQAQAKSTKSIGLKFSGELGEQFSIQLTLNEDNKSEAFVI